MIDRLRDKVVFVTGAASVDGLGFAIARRAGSEGARLLITDRNDDIHSRAAELAAIGIEAIAQVQDVTDDASWAPAIDFALDRFGRLDGMVNNAGAADLAPLAEMTPQTFRQSLDINLTAPYAAIRHAVAAMRQHGEGGSIVNISSVAGIIGFRDAAAYAASKGGLRIMSKALAIELAAEGIRCNSVHPGSIETAMLRHVADLDPARHAAIIAGVPMKKLGKPDDIAACACYLLSDEAGYVTGAEIVIDGGLSAQ